MKALLSLPPAVLRKIESSLAFISVVRDLGGTAYADYLVTDDKGFAPYGFIVFDTEVLQRKANEWATWKESSPFVNETGSKLTATIEESANDDRVHAIQYVLLHEIGHVISFSLEEFPWAKDDKQTVAKRLSTGFPAESWSIANGRVASRFDAQLPWRGDIHYYSAPEHQKPMALARQAYADLPNTDFPTLYATTNFNDDFADSFASYVHTELQQKPWEIRIETPGEEPLIYKTCWQEERCRKKRLILESILGL